MKPRKMSKIVLKVHWIKISENKILQWLQIEVGEITNWGARMPQNTFGWRWLLIEDFCPPPSHISYSTHYVFTQLINDCAFVNLRRSSKLLWSNLDYFKLNLLCWIIIILTSWSQHPLWALIIWGINLFVSVIPSGFDYHAGYRIKIQLICRLTKDRDQVLISKSTIQEFPALIIVWSFILRDMEHFQNKKRF